jgi:phenylacetate-coenzyme A ligase PaaK-like adenylate-forming protein
MAAPLPLDPWCAARIGATPPLDRADLTRHQLDRLRATLAWAIDRSPFYRRQLAGVDPHAINDLASLATLPFTCADDLRRNQPSLLCVSQSDINRVVTLETSATSGSPKRLYFTAEEQQETIDFFRCGMSQMVSAHERVLILFPCTRPGGVGQLLAEALSRLGAVPIAAGPISDMDAALQCLAAERPQVVAGLPMQVRALARCSRLRGIESAVHAVLLSADQVSPRLRQDIGDDWQCEVFEHYGMTETGLGGAVECTAHAGCHIRENDLLVEIIDPHSGRVLCDGERGEVVVTTLTRRGMPLIRYRSGDLGRLIPGRCRCGSLLKRLDAIERIHQANAVLSEGIALSLGMLDEVLLPLPWLTDFDVVWHAGAAPGLEIGLYAGIGLADPAAAMAQAAAGIGQLAAVRAARAANGLKLALSFCSGALSPRRAKRVIEQGRSA